MTETLLAGERDAKRQLNLGTSRKWKVINPAKKNSLGQAVGYALAPAENATPMAQPDSFLRTHAGFVNAHFWATRYEPRELYAAGDYTNLSQPGEGLPKWTSANRSLESQDVVIWYTLGVTHVPRPEEWPVMTAHRAGFKLVPAGFFSRNPALDVPAR
jgi:primary-amine oxidase